ncbi:hypothetical protein ABT160_29945 [Streptomyces sp. NPDC001941]|uniref:hypothetical protein n=1 Tax=Streptomyces sp. NPDC001941 TaxID=3154659 RepID=UPI003317804B
MTHHDPTAPEPASPITPALERILLADFEDEDIAAMRAEGDLPAFLRLQMRLYKPVQVVALWQRFSPPYGHQPGAWPSATLLTTDYQPGPGPPKRCDCTRCRALAIPCGADPCRCPHCGTPHTPAA